MIRTLLTTSAITAILSISAIAQDAVPPPPPAEPTIGQQLDNTLENAGEALDNAGEAVRQGAQDAGQAVENAVNDASADLAHATRTPWEFSAGYTIGANDFIVNDLLGAPVYSSGADDAQEIGKVNDLIITADGDINAVVIGVGGFLGIGEKNVAVDYLSLENVMAADNTWRWVLPTTAEALEAAPEFIWENPRAPVAPATDSMAPAPVVSQ
ncbi:PRC-barrel domain-containing protein [Devosia faecipullorum]|uniref:PRC-barrel domain-containing protein n=1 Tax=Devosia faecipullorum TaxID=2755039 RepID=UPI00187BBEC1|nr:PRC-barrel domain-containing protein [Devosia faecipullorum]MBE7733157.1 PRC-barrel domain-containing protein [Devosia faecipullorum]